MTAPLLSAPADDPDRLLSLADIGELVGLGTSATKVLVRRRDFPGAIRLSQRTVRWWHSEVRAWLEAQRSHYRPRATHPGAPPGAACTSVRRRRPRRHH